MNSGVSIESLMIDGLPEYIKDNNNIRNGKNRNKNDINGNDDIILDGNTDDSIDNDVNGIDNGAIKVIIPKRAWRACRLCMFTPQ